MEKQLFVYGPCVRREQRDGFIMKIWQFSDLESEVALKLLRILY